MCGKPSGQSNDLYSVIFGLHLHWWLDCSLHNQISSLTLFSDHAYAQRKSHSLLTDTPQALLVQAPDEVSTQVAPCGLSVAAGLEVVPLSVLFSGIGVLGAAQDSDDARPAQQVWYLARTDPQGIGSLQAWRRAGRVSAVCQLNPLSVRPQVTELD